MRFGRVGESVGHVGEEGEELHEQRVGGQHRVAETRRGCGEEGIGGHQTEGAQKNILVDVEKAGHGLQTDAFAQVGVFRQAAVIACPEEPRDGHTRVLRHHRTPGDARDAHAEPEDEQGAEEDVHHIGDDGYDHRCAGVLHADEPAVDGEEGDGGRGGPDAGEEVLRGECLRPFAALHQPQRESPQGIAQHDEQQGQYHGYGHRADQDAGALPQVAGAVGLCRDAARPHAQEAAGPVDHVEDRRPDTDGAYRGGTVVQSACDGRIDHSQQRNGDVGDDVRYGEPQDLPVHPVHNSSHACSYACKGIFFPWDTPIPPSEKRPATAALRVW